MYTQRFGLAQEPFSIAPDPRFLYMSERHREALAHLLYGLQAGGGFVLLTGEIGAGKTTVCRCFLEQLPATCNVAYIFNPRLSVGELMVTICEEFGIGRDARSGSTMKAYVDALNHFLLRNHADGKTSVLIIDEAQNLSAAVLEQLRLLTNLETNERKLLQIILIGQPELRRQLTKPSLEQLAQRVIARYHLRALGPADVEPYVRHRLAVAGHAGSLPFDGAALRRIHGLTGGVPRRINLLCDRALLGAYAEGRERVDARTLKSAAAEVFETTSGPHRDGVWPRVAFAAGAVGVLASALLWALRDRPDAIADAPVAALAASAPADELGVSAGSGMASGAAGTATEAGAQAASASAAAFAARVPFSDEKAAWQALGRLWQLDIAAPDPCAAVETLALSCYRGQTTLPVLRQLDRPALLALDGSGAARRWVVLTALDDTRAGLLLADGPVLVDLPTLVARWRGDFATLWRRPSGYAGSAAANANSALAGWLGETLGRFQGDTLAPSTPLRERIAAFQRAQGLTPDGLAGPITLMQMNRVAGADEPQLADTGTGGSAGGN